MPVIWMSALQAWFHVGIHFFTFPSCKRSCAVPWVCHADANKPLQVAMATRLIRNGLMLGLIHSNFPSLGCNEMVKGLKDLELPALGKIWKRRVSCCSLQNRTWIFEFLHQMCLCGVRLVWRIVQECQRRPLQPGSWFQLSYLSTEHSQELWDTQHQLHSPNHSAIKRN